MNAEQMKQYLEEIESALTSVSGLTAYHIDACKLSLQTIERVFSDPPEELAQWSHFTMVVEKEWFATAGYDVSDLTKAEMDALTDELFDYCITGRGYDRGIHVAAEGILTLTEEEEEESRANSCPCCFREKAFVPDPHGVCAICGHEHTEHGGVED